MMVKYSPEIHIQSILSSGLERKWALKNNDLYIDNLIIHW